MFLPLSTPRAITSLVALNLFLAATTSVQQCSGFANIESGIRSQRKNPAKDYSYSTKERWAYGKNAEIWPETNEDPVTLSDSFPNGDIPYSAILMIEQQDMDSYHETVEDSIAPDETTTFSTTKGAEEGQPQRRRGVKRQFVSRSIRRILRRAAAKEELDSEPESTGLDKTPILIALALLVRGLVRPLDVALVAFLTGYGVILGQVARSPRETSGVPMLPATPPQGHVPAMVSNPLGMGIMYSKVYDLWLKLGVLIGLVGPVALLSHYVLFADKLAAARICAPPIFLLCCQAITEAISRKVIVSDGILFVFRSYSFIAILSNFCFFFESMKW
jgi:hypothetical protein